MEYDKDARATELIKRFRSLVKHAEIVAFPQAKNSLFLPVNMEAWHPVRKVLHKATTPYLYINEKDKSWVIYFLLSFFLFIMVIYSLALAQQIANNHAVGFSKSLFGTLVVFSFLSLYGFIGFLRDSRYHIILRIALFIILGIICLGVSANLFPLTAPHLHTITSLSGFLKVYFLVFSAFSLTMLFFINTLLIALLIYIQLINFTETIQTPINDQFIKKLLEAQIEGDTENKQSWKVLDLPKNEITYLRLWSESSLASSEKRTIPALVLAPLIGILWSIDGIRNLLLAPFTPSLSNSPQSLPGYIALILALSFVVVFSRSMIAIFKNIAVQSLILETCLIAEYAVEEKKEIPINENNNLPGNLFKAIIQKILGLI